MRCTRKYEKSVHIDPSFVKDLLVRPAMGFSSKNIHTECDKCLGMLKRKIDYAQEANCLNTSFYVRTTHHPKLSSRYVTLCVAKQCQTNYVSRSKIYHVQCGMDARNANKINVLKKSYGHGNVSANCDGILGI